MYNNFRFFRGFIWPVYIINCTAITFIIFGFGFCAVNCLKKVIIEVPVAVKPGDTVHMRCLYDLEGDQLYTVKWYKGRQEFFRYVPKELPHTRIFPLPGVNVDVNLSGPNDVVLRDVQKDLAGKYRCEVSADAPSFITQVVASHMNVVYAPEGIPTIILEKSQYTVGDTLKGNCTSPPSVPAANITLYINNKQINSSYTHHAIVEQNELDTNLSHTFNELWTTTVGLEFQVNTFQLRQLRIQCVADLYEVYSTQTEIVLQEERPKLASILYNRDSAIGLQVNCGSSRLPLFGFIFSLLFALR